MIKLSEDFAEKLMEAIFQKINSDKWYSVWAYWLIDSKYREKKFITEFLSEQIVNKDDSLIKLSKTFKGDNNTKIINILKYVKNNFTYKKDIEGYGTNEYWAKSTETLNNKYGDCDDLNSLIYVLARLSGVPDYLLYSCIGNTNSGGHYWCLYFDTSNRKLVSIDATYHYSNKCMKDRDEFKLTSQRYQKIWYIFNDKFTFKQKS